ncbi:glycosyltransferase [Ottowia thiooxydans]|uniref:glycosyltransferase n=1 Tax=Ottowia thiooxydans TaxID=219182 RepID=UPI0004905870|nr:glycosyltransferase [Ottowia thiooxydans]
MPRCTILALGSRGDIQPLLALAMGLKKAGYSVRFAAPADFEEWVSGLGLEYARLAGSSADFYGGAAGVALRERIRDPKKFTRFLNDYLGLFLDRLFKSCWEACQDSDVILCWSWTRVGPSLAEKLKIPLVIVSPTPVLHLPTFAFANPFQGPPQLQGRNLGPLYNRWSWRWAEPFTRIGQTQVDRWREQTLGLPPLDWKTELRQLRSLPHLFGYSPAVLPKPWDWGANAHVTGYWFLEQKTQFTPPAPLAEFLAAGEAPVALGFSSQIGRDAKRISSAVMDGLARSGKRGLLIAGWGGIGQADLPSNVFKVDSVPYDWLLPRVAGLVHQGGAGSTAEALRAGIPNVAVTFGYEQALWGARIARLGAGVAPIPAASLNADNLSEAIVRLVDKPRFRQNAQAVAETLRAEDGVGEVVRIIERAIRRK